MAPFPGAGKWGTGSGAVAVGVVGIGSVNSGAGTALVLERFHPSAVIFNGVAGALGGMEPGDVVLGQRSIQYGFAFLDDKGYNPWPTFALNGTDRNPLYFEADPVLLAAGQRAGAVVSLPPLTFQGKTRQPGVMVGCINTEDIFSVVRSRNQSVIDQTGCSLFEEEGGAVAQICFQQKVPCLIVRGFPIRPMRMALRSTISWVRSPRKMLSG